jgi:hypothetical protein
MKIEESFRDWKSLLGLSQLMNKQQIHLEQMLALSLLAYVLGLFLGEGLRDVRYGGLDPEQISSEELFLPPPRVSRGSKWNTYSGLFVLLKQRLKIPPDTLRHLLRSVQQAFTALLFGNVRSFV